MTFRFASAAAGLATLVLASCATETDLKIVSGSRPATKTLTSYTGSSSSSASLSTPAALGNVYTTETPSTAVTSHAEQFPKDRHGMPLYRAADRTRLVRTTAYTHTENDHIQYGSMNAAGTPLRYTSRVRSAAADWAVYPIGTVFRIKGMSQLFVVDDYGSALTGTGTIDIYTPSKEFMGIWGRRNVEISIVQWGSYARSTELLAKRQHFPHCRQMYAAIQKMSAPADYTAAR